MCSTQEYKILYLRKPQMSSALIRRKRKEQGEILPAQHKTKKRRNCEIEEVAWEEEIDKRKDGKIFNQYSGFADDEKIRGWEFQTGIAPMRHCSCDMCNLHGRRRTEYLLCSITQGRHNSYDVTALRKLFEKEGLDRFLPEDELEIRIVEATRNKTVLLSRPESDRLEEAIDPKVPIGEEVGINFHACKYSTLFSM